MSMTAPINLNLWLLTGRHDDFVNAQLNSGGRRSSNVKDAALVEARGLLHLGDTSADFYVIGAMAALVVAGSVTGDAGIMFLPYSHTLPGPTIAGGKFVTATGGGELRLLYRPTSLPAAATWRVSRKEDVAEVKNDIGERWELPYHYIDGVVYVDWSSFDGFDFAFRPTEWLQGSFVEIKLPPVGYPYQAVASAALQSNTLLSLLAEEGELTAFHAARGAIWRVGALASAIVKRSDRLNPD